MNPNNTLSTAELHQKRAEYSDRALQALVRGDVEEATALAMHWVFLTQCLRDELSALVRPVEAPCECEAPADAWTVHA